MYCKICNHTVNKIFEAKVLDKYQVSYSQCSECFFIQTEEPYWLEESYTSAITALDIGLIERNIQLSNIVSTVIKLYFNQKTDLLILLVDME